MIPFCPDCGEVRDTGELHSQAQVFRRRHPGFLLAQELCPDCQRKPPPDAEPED
jgi:hypothetical protein